MIILISGMRAPGCNYLQIKFAAIPIDRLYIEEIQCRIGRISCEWRDERETMEGRCLSVYYFICLRCDGSDRCVLFFFLKHTNIGVFRVIRAFEDENLPKSFGVNARYRNTRNAL